MNKDKEAVTNAKVPAQGKGLTQKEILVHVVWALVSAAGMTLWSQSPTPYVLVRIALAAYIMALASSLGTAYTGGKQAVYLHAILFYWFYQWAKWALLEQFEGPLEKQFFPVIGAVTWGSVIVHLVSRFFLPHAHE